MKQHIWQFWAKTVICFFVIALSGLLAAWTYRYNNVFLFYGSAIFIPLTILLFVSSKAGAFRVYVLGFANFLLFFFLGLAICQVVFVMYKKVCCVPIRPTYSYIDAKGDPASFRYWWRDYLRIGHGMQETIQEPDPLGVLPFVLKPNAKFRQLQSTISINSMGFRGTEFALNKSGQYRIVCIGESTTFGTATMFEGDRPWPEVLERLIQEHLSPDKRIEVINGGVLAYNLKDSLSRIERDILPLKPDMLISYHGYNGIKFLMNTIPDLRAKIVPVYNPFRPSVLLANVEYLTKLLIFKIMNMGGGVHENSIGQDMDDALSSEYAGLYKRLITTSSANGMKLVLCSFNMAVTSESPEPVIEFYRQTFPHVIAAIKVIDIHNKMLNKLADASGVTFVNTGPALNGAYENSYLDLIHFTQRGRDQLAANIFKGITPSLELSGLIDGQSINQSTTQQ